MRIILLNKANRPGDHFLCYFHHGTDGPLLVWFTDYLENRQQQIVVDNSCSTFCPESSGVIKDLFLVLCSFWYSLMTYPTAFAMVRVLLSLRMTLNVSDRYIQEQTLFISKPISHPSTNGVFATIYVSTYQNAMFWVSHVNTTQLSSVTSLRTVKSVKLSLVRI